MQLYGRDTELAQLMAANDAAAAGRPQLAWIEGEPGSGKTRLVQAFYDALSRVHDPAVEVSLADLPAN
ncbi:MAG: ATP-binding protein [bacterium]|nr:ATP-binding protein [bacterium]